MADVRPLPKTLADVQHFQHPRVIERYIADHGVPHDVALLRFEGLKEFLVVCAALPGQKVASMEIDTMWHAFLMFTRDYRTFCETYLGRFINHEPFEKSNPAAYSTTRAFAEKTFGKLDATVWPLQGKADCTSGCED